MNLEILVNAWVSCGGLKENGDIGSLGEGLHEDESISLIDFRVAISLSDGERKRKDEY